jgi:hypothetical protein
MYEGVQLLIPHDVSSICTRAESSSRGCQWNAPGGSDVAQVVIGQQAKSYYVIGHAPLGPARFFLSPWLKLAAAICETAHTRVVYPAHFPLAELPPIITGLSRARPTQRVCPLVERVCVSPSQPRPKSALRFRRHNCPHNCPPNRYTHLRFTSPPSVPLCPPFISAIKFGTRRNSQPVPEFILTAFLRHPLFPTIRAFG